MLPGKVIDIEGCTIPGHCNKQSIYPFHALRRERGEYLWLFVAAPQGTSNQNSLFHVWNDLPKIE